MLRGWFYIYRRIHLLYIYIEDLYSVSYRISISKIDILMPASLSVAMLRNGILSQRLWIFLKFSMHGYTNLYLSCVWKCMLPALVPSFIHSLMPFNLAFSYNYVKFALQVLWVSDSWIQNSPFDAFLCSLPLHLFLLSSLSPSIPLFLLWCDCCVWLPRLPSKPSSSSASFTLYCSSSPWPLWYFTEYRKGFWGRRRGRYCPQRSQAHLKQTHRLVAQSCLLCDPTDRSPPGSSAHGILQARRLEWVAISFSRGSSPPRDRTCISCLAGRFFTIEPPGKP